MKKVIIFEKIKFSRQNEHFKKTITAMIMVVLLSFMFGISALAAGIKPTALNDFESSTANVTSYNMSLPTGTTSKVQQIEMSHPGRLEIDIYSSGLSSFVYFELYSNSGCTERVGGSASIYASRLTDQFYANIPKAATYYLKIYRSAYYSDNTANFTIKPYSYSGADKTLKSGAWSGTYATDYNQTIYHKVVISKPGYITVQGYSKGSISTPKSSVSISLTNSKKKALEGSFLSSGNNFTTYFGVKKGTYYIAVKNYGHYKLKYTFKAVSDKSGSSKRKATTLKKNKPVKGLLISNESAKKSDWFKIKLTKKKKISFKVNANVSDYFRVKLIPKNSRIYGTSKLIGPGITSLKTTSKLPAGTYYIQITKYSASSPSSGVYSITLK